MYSYLTLVFCCKKNTGLIKLMLWFHTECNAVFQVLFFLFFVFNSVQIIFHSRILTSISKALNSCCHASQLCSIFPPWHFQLGYKVLSDFSWQLGRLSYPLYKTLLPCLDHLYCATLSLASFSHTHRCKGLVDICVFI